MKRWLVLAAVVLAAVVLAAASAQETRYEFERIEVSHAATFEAHAANESHEDWATARVGQIANVTFGTVRLHTSGHNMSEGFLKIEGPDGAWRALLNGGHWEYDVDGAPTQIALLFWSAKQVDGNDIVKNFTPPIHSVRLIQHLEGGEVTAVELWTDEGEDAASGQWWESTRGKHWHAHIDTFRQVGQMEAP